MEVFAGHVGSGETLVLAGPAWSVAPKPYLALNASAGIEHHLGARHRERRVERSGSCLEKFAVMGGGGRPAEQTELRVGRDEIKKQR